MEEEVEAAKLLIFETIAESDDTLLEKYLEGEELTTEELFEGLRRGIADGVIIPALAASAERMIGVDRVLDVIAGMNKSASRVTADVQDNSSARIHFRIDVKDQTEVERVKDAVSRIDDVTRIYRSRPGLKA